MEGGEVQVPTSFLCPISLQIMTDPVTLHTGITYDRHSIEQWLCSSTGHCPVTKQLLSADVDLITPNHTLRRLIQAWCTANSSVSGLDRFPSPPPPPPPPLHKSQVIALLGDAQRASKSQLIPALKKLKKVVDSEGEGSKRCLGVSAGAVGFLASIISTLSSKDGNAEDVAASDEAVSILYSLEISEQGMRAILRRHQNFLSSLTALMRRTLNRQSRANAVLLLKSLIRVIPAAALMNLQQDFFEEIVEALRDRLSYQVMKAALQVLYGVCPQGRNTVKSVHAGAVPVLVELLLDESEKRGCEMIMVVLDELCGCADGRSAVVGHAAGLAVIAKKMVRISSVATESAVRILYAVSLHPGTATVIGEMMEVGVVSKLCFLLQVECGKSTREMMKEMLRMNFRVWSCSPCFEPQLKSLYRPHDVGKLCECCIGDLIPGSEDSGRKQCCRPLYNRRSRET